MAVFEALLEGETVDHMQTLLVAPHCLQNKLIDMIDGEIAKVNAGQKGVIRLKMNSLTDKTLIDKLIEASQAGVQIDMIVRGICCLRGGVVGETDNIRIISVVGRFLEHSRIYIFGEGEEARYYISSADWMTRNTLRRVEIATPVLDSGCKARLERIFDVIWRDNVQAREQQPDGNYRRRYPGVQTPVSSQNWLYDEAYRMASEAK
jgi:polyphosphate kinase